jgi:hypothetical protein
MRGIIWGIGKSICARARDSVDRSHQGLGASAVRSGATQGCRSGGTLDTSPAFPTPGGDDEDTASRRDA